MGARKIKALNSILLLVLFLAGIIFANAEVYAFSEYGLRCEDNNSCIKCRNNVECIKCMHRCWNAYGYADSDVKNTKELNSEEACQLKRAKWCNAQCWDPDDTKKPDYISTKPQCAAKSFYHPEGGIKFPAKKPSY